MLEKVGIVLVNYNGRKYIVDCINSLLNQTYKNITILFWDNHSNDDSAKIVKQMYPQIHLIESKYNYGFAKANNLAVKKIFQLETGLEYVLLLNVDTLADQFLIERLLSKADANTVTTARIYMGRHGTKDWYAGGELRLDIGQSRHLLIRNCTVAKQVSFISGCCMMIHKDIIKKYGLFDSAYYMYCEDTDLCMRWFLNDVRMYYVPQAKLWHKVGGSIGGIKNPIKKYYMVRNNLYFGKKYKDYIKANLLRMLCAVIKEEIKDVWESDYRMVRAAWLGILDFGLKKMGKIKHKI